MSTLPSGTVTFLFTDLEGSTKHQNEQPAAIQAALDRHDAILYGAISANQGSAYKKIGNQFQAAFSTASDAVAAAYAAQRALSMEPWQLSEPLAVRMALHTGVTEERDGQYSGPLLNRVARLLSAAHGDQVLLTMASEELVRGALPEGITLRDLGEHRLKDLTRPEHVFQLIAPDLPGNFPALKTLDASPNNLPLQPTLLIGREKEVEECCGLLRRDDVWLLTLTGPAGTGKTRLGVQVAAELLGEFSDGVFFISLAPISDPNLVISTIAQTLGMREAGGQSLGESLTEYLLDREMLLVVDNFEQVPEAAPMVAELLDACPRLKILVTSRVALHISMENEYPVPSLRLPDRRQLPALAILSQYEAVALFIARSQAVKPDFRVTNENAPAVAEICYRLDGLPLAIELAAARSKILSPQVMLSRLSSSLNLLTGGPPDLPARQRTMRATIAWSYDLLDEMEQALFRRLAIFVGGCTFEAIGYVHLEDGGSPRLSEDGLFDLVASLVDKNLLRQEEANVEPRFWMMETMREFGLERLEESGEEESTRRAHGEYFVALAERAAPETRGPEQVLWLGKLESEHDNLRASLEWARIAENGAEIGLRLAGALWEFWWRRGYLSEGRERLVAVLSKVNERTLPPPTATLAKAIYGAGYLALVQGDYPAAHEKFEQSLPIYRQLDDQSGIALALTGLGHEARYQRDFATARSLYEQTLEIRRQLDDRRGMGISLNNLGLVACDEGDYATGRLLLEQSRVIFRQSGDNWGTAFVLNNLGFAARGESDYVQAQSLVAESLRIRRDLGDQFGVAYCLAGLGGAACGQGLHERAATLFGATEAVLATIGARLEPLFQGELDKNMDISRSALGEKSFAVAREKGHAMTLEEATAYALQEVEVAA